MRQVCKGTDGIEYKKNFGYDVSRPLLGYSLLISSGNFWKHQRKVCQFSILYFNHLVVLIFEILDFGYGIYF